jgi:tRNA A37 N6-isopentenylltransferase MiaA
MIPPARRIGNTGASPRRGARGTALIEFALVFPFLLVLTLCVVDMSRAFFIKNILHQAAREGVRTLVVMTMADADSVEARVRRQVDEGLEAEVRALMGGPWSREAREAVTYREVRAKIEGKVTLSQAIEAMIRRNWRLTRRQKSWARSLTEVRALQVAPEEAPASVAARVASALESPA